MSTEPDAAPQPGTAAWDMAVMRRLAAMRESIEESGFLMECTVAGSADEYMQHLLMYTIGMSERRWPELVLTGMHPLVGATLLTRLGGQVQRAGVAPRAGRRYTVPLDHGTARVHLVRRVPAEQRDKPLAWAHRYYGRQVAELAVRVAGWPCRRCTPRVAGAECRCEFYCAWEQCGKPVPQTAQS